ncbi:tyrosine-type recombinase/integrase [Planktothrix agardhii]|jgi:integrase/recombinase XerD|uniref:tyrosine-type recombinase/integrase n=1 Tax=Planktothrix agardhii TaxID=1160 RepID=UPI00042A6A7A|nr:tyrosine-type recombinase/integrase [Planktothrix agardhii]
MTPLPNAQPYQHEHELAEIPIGHNHTLEQILEMWLHGKTPGSQAIYRRVVVQFLEWANKPLQWLTLPDVQGFANYLDTKGLKPSTRASYLAAVKSLLTFCNRTGLTRANVGAAVPLPKGKDTLTQKILAKEQVMAMIYSEPNRRNQLILKSFYYCGVRVSELCGLCWYDLTASGDSGILTVFGKGSKTRHVLLPAHLYKELLNFRGNASNDDPIFPSRKGKGKGHLHRIHVTKLVKEAGIRVGIDEKVSAHWLRHCHASHSLDAGAPISLVQTTLGHASVATTSKYLHAKPTESSGLYL